MTDVAIAIGDGFSDGALFCCGVASCSGFSAMIFAMPLQCGIAACSAQQSTMHADVIAAGSATAAIQVRMMKSRFTRRHQLHVTDRYARKYSSNGHRLAQ